MSRPKRRSISGLVTLGLLVGGVAYLFASSAGEAFEYYKHVDEIMAQPRQWEHKHLQIHGFVVPGSIAKRIDKEHQQIEYKFQAVNCGKQMEVRYAGTVPDTFKDRAEVVVKGTLADGTLRGARDQRQVPVEVRRRSPTGRRRRCARAATRTWRLRRSRSRNRT